MQGFVGWLLSVNGLIDGTDDEKSRPVKNEDFVIGPVMGM